MAILRVTVVIATRNRCRELTRTLRLLSVTPEDPTVIVVDNASTDGTAEVIRQEFPRVRLVRLSRNQGAVARNVGVELADTPYVAFSDDDSWWEPGALTAAADVLDAHPRVALVAARPMLGDGRAADPIADAMAASPLPGEDGQPGPPVLGFLGCAAVVRRDAFLGVGGFSDLLFHVGEERLLAYDLAAAGWRLNYVASVVAVHDASPRRVSRAHRDRLEQRNELLTAWLR